MRFQSYIYFLHGSFLLYMPGFPVEGNWDAGRTTEQPGSYLDRGPGSVLMARCRLLLIQGNLWSVGLNSQVGICSSTGKMHRGLQSRRRWELVSVSDGAGPFCAAPKHTQQVPGSSLCGWSELYFHAAHHHATEGWRRPVTSLIFWAVL